MEQQMGNKDGEIIGLCDERKSMPMQSISATAVSAVVHKIIDRITHASLPPDLKKIYCERLSGLEQDENIIRILFSGDYNITPMDVKYILCFHIDMAPSHISQTFSVEVASVYTVRYRIRKKFRDNPAFQFLM